MNFREVNFELPLDFGKLNDSNDYLLPVIVVDSDQLARDGIAAIRMLGFMNQEAYELTKQTGLVTFWSRTRRELWTKGETSGNVLRVRAIYADCDFDTLLIDAEAVGPTCHTGAASCFGLPNKAEGTIADFNLVEWNRR